MSQLGVDAHQRNQPADMLQSGHTDLNSNIGSLDGYRMQDLHHSGWVDLPQAPGVDHSPTSWNSSTHYEQLPDTGGVAGPVASPHHYDASDASGHHSSHSVLNSSYAYASSSNSYHGPCINIDSHGDLYLHGLNGKTETVGYVRGRDFYNSANWHVGSLGKDGHIYDRWGNSVGTVEAGHVYRQNGKEVARAGLRRCSSYVVCRARRDSLSGALAPPTLLEEMYYD